MRVLGLAAVVVSLLASGCQTEVDLTKGLEVTDVSTGWSNAGDVNGQNKMVPTISFRFKNNSAQTLGTLQANVLFRRVNEEAEWGSSYVRVIGTEGLAPGASSDVQKVSCPKGYTGTETRTQMMANSNFVDARVRIFAKYGSTQWAPVGDFVVDRQLLAQ